MGILEKGMKILTHFVQTLTGLLFTAVFSACLLRIVMRNLVGNTWFWLDGLTRLMFIWVVFLGAAALYATDDHLMMPYFLDKMSAKWQRRMQVLINISFLFIAVIIVYYGNIVFKVRLRIPYTAWNFPTGFAYLAAPVSGVLMVVFCVSKIWILLKRTRPNPLDTNLLNEKKEDNPDGF